MYLETSDPDELCAEQMHLTEWFCEKVLTPVVDSSARSTTTTVFEGDDLRPRWAARYVGNRSVRAVWVVAGDRDQLAHRFAAKTGLTGRRLEAHTTTHWLYSEALRREAQDLGFPVVNLEPIETVAARTIVALGLDSSDAD
jgi:hypothetical protein